MRPTSAKEMQALLKRNGAVYVRRKGSHEQWRLPNKKVFTVAVSKENYASRRTVLNRLTELRRLYPALVEE